MVGPPLFDQRGRVYTVTVDGYLHAYENDGRYRFSYTVSGTPLGPPRLRATDGAILIGTTRRFIYAITPQGSLSLRARTVTPVWSGLSPLDDDSLVYIGLDQKLYALSNYGAALYRVPIPGQPMGEPQVGDDGVVWIPLESGVARMHRALRVTRVPFSSPVEQVVPRPGGAVVLAGGRVVEVSDAGKKKLLGLGEWLFHGQGAVGWLDATGRGGWLPPDRPARQVPLDIHGSLAGSIHAEPALGAVGLLVPLQTGELVHFPWRDGELGSGHRLWINGEPLLRPVVHQRHVALGTAAGNVCLVRLPGDPAADRQ